MLVRDLMSTGISPLSPDTPVSAVVHLPVEHGMSGIPVTNADGVLLGMVTEGDLLGRAALSDEPRHGWFQPHWIVAVALRGPRSPRLARP